MRWRDRKKNASECPPAAVSDARTLAESYEALRKDMVERSGCAHAMRGCALLMFKGMAVWMKCMGEATSCTRTPVLTRNDSSQPVGIQQNLVAIVATMVLANALEDIA